MLREDIVPFVDMVTNYVWVEYIKHSDECKRRANVGIKKDFEPRKSEYWFTGEYNFKKIAYSIGYIDAISENDNDFTTKMQMLVNPLFDEFGYNYRPLYFSQDIEMYEKYRDENGYSPITRGVK